MTGHDPDHGHIIRDRADVKVAIGEILEDRADESDITAEWLLYEAVDNHRIARAAGNLSASNIALNIIAKHRNIDAFTADKMVIAGDAEVMARLLRGRHRVTPASPDVDIGDDLPETVDDITFI